MTRTTQSLLVLMLDTVLTPDTAERVVDYRLPQDVLDRLEVLREKAGEDQLDSSERREYAAMIEEMDVMSLIKIKARRLLATAADSSDGLIQVGRAIAAGA